MHFRKLWKERRIFEKVLIVVLSAIIFSGVSCSLAIYLYLEPMIRSSIIERDEEMIQKMLGEVNNNIEDIYQYAMNISFDDTIQESLDMQNTNDVFAYYSSVQKAEKKLREYVFLRDAMIYDIFIMSEHSSAMEMMKIYGDIVNGPVYKKISEENMTGITPRHQVLYNSSGGIWNTTAYVSNVYSKKNPNLMIGKLAMIINIDSLVNPIVFNNNENIKIEIRNEQGGLIFSQDDSLNLEEMLSEEKNADKIIFKQDMTSDWYAVCYISDNQVSNAFRTINTIIFSIVILCLVVTIIVISKIVSNIVRPLENLIDGMKRVGKGSRSVRIAVDTGDEIELATHVFNQMVDDINSHTQKSLENERNAHEARLKMLMYQINPHFIYNTLNCIICLARRDDCNRIVNLTKTFIVFLRSILKVDSHAMTTLRDEINYINHYVSIMQFSYDSVSNVIWDIDPELIDISIPRLILYPLVENGVFYGILPKEGDSYLKISVSKIENEVEIEVKDTGRGLQPEALKEIRDLLKLEDDNGEHIGLTNVNSRLVLIYGPNASLKINSVFGEGTSVSFCIDLCKNP